MPATLFTIAMEGIFSVKRLRTTVLRHVRKSRHLDMVMSSVASKVEEQCLCEPARKPRSAKLRGAEAVGLAPVHI